MTRPAASDAQIATMPPMRPFVIGTAGHVDHGKSTLVKALTGIDPDRPADEGPMPQTVEHLAILDLLGVNRGLIVLTKADAVEADWLDLVREEVRELVSTTTLADAPVVTVSALTGEGLPVLLETLDAVLASSPGTPA